jgi:hypothetical protein
MKRTLVFAFVALFAASAGLAAQTSPAPRSRPVERPARAEAPEMTSVDTIVQLRRGDRVILDNVGGEVSVEGWNRDELELRGEGEVFGLVVRRSGSQVLVTRDDRKGRQRSVEASLRVPIWVDFEASARSLDLRVTGVDGSIDIRNVSGDVSVGNVGGRVQVRTVQGEIDIMDARGGVSASSQSDDVRLTDVSGPVNAHSGSGDVLLVNIRSVAVRAETQDGDITFTGSITDGGEYGFFVHDGDAIIAIPEGVNASVGVSTFDGDFESEFPVLLQRFTGGREFDFVIGEPRASIQIQVFDGEIRLLRSR